MMTDQTPPPRDADGELRGICARLIATYREPVKGLAPKPLTIEDAVTELQSLIQAHTAKANERGAIDFRSKVSTGGRPLSAPPEIVKQPVPCPRCGAEEYADWVLYPHQLYNSYMPGGIGHYCFPCFAAIVSELQAALHSEQEKKNDE